VSGVAAPSLSQPIDTVETMRLYHSTRRPKIAGVLAGGLVGRCAPAAPVEVGVSLSERAMTRAGDDALIAVDLPDEVVDPAWRSRHDPTEWHVPAEILRTHGELSSSRRPRTTLGG
jgi:hypothetical protein